MPLVLEALESPARNCTWCWKAAADASRATSTTSLRAAGVPEQSAVLLGMLVLRGPQTAGELRLNTERWYKFLDIASVDGFLEELQDRSARQGRPAGGETAARTRRARTALGPPALRPGGHHRPRRQPPRRREVRGATEDELIALTRRVWPRWKTPWPRCRTSCRI